MQPDTHEGLAGASNAFERLKQTQERAKTDAELAAKLAAKAKADEVEAGDQAGYLFASEVADHGDLASLAEVSKLHPERVPLFVQSKFKNAVPGVVDADFRQGFVAGALRLWAEFEAQTAGK